MELQTAAALRHLTQPGHAALPAQGNQEAGVDDCMVHLMMSFAMPLPWHLRHAGELQSLWDCIHIVHQPTARYMTAQT